MTQLSENPRVLHRVKIREVPPFAVLQEELIALALYEEFRARLRAEMDRTDISSNNGKPKTS